MKKRKNSSGNSTSYEAGATLIAVFAVHARYRVTFHRKGPGARDGPALLDQVGRLKQAFPNKLLIVTTNGNRITYDDVEKNLKDTQADGIMSAEGILDNPALFLRRLENNPDLIPMQGGDQMFWKQRKQRQEQGKKLFTKLKKD